MITFQSELASTRDLKGVLQLFYGKTFPRYHEKIRVKSVNQIKIEDRLMEKSLNLSEGLMESRKRYEICLNFCREAPSFACGMNTKM